MAESSLPPRLPPTARTIHGRGLGPGLIGPEGNLAPLISTLVCGEKAPGLDKNAMAGKECSYHREGKCWSCKGPVCMTRGELR